MSSDNKVVEASETTLKQLDDALNTEESDKVTDLQPLPPPNQKVDGKTPEEWRDVGKVYARNLCDHAVTELLNYIAGEDKFVGLSECGHISAKSKSGNVWQFNYEVKSNHYVHEIPKELQDEKGGPNPAVTEAISQLIKLVSLHYDNKLTEKFYSLTTEEDKKALARMYRGKPFLDGAANLHLSNDTDKCLGLVFTKV
jgi:hypothetical protein